MFQATASIISNAKSLSNGAVIKTSQQNTEYKSTSTSSRPSDNSEKEQSLSQIASESEEESSVQGDQIPATESKFSLQSKVSKARSPPSYHDRAAPKLVSHWVDSDKRIRKQIRNIQKAIKQESSRKSSKANSGILRGLKKALARLNDTRIPASQSPLFQSQPQSSQMRGCSPEKESCVEGPLFSGSIRQVVPQTAQQVLTEPENALPFSNTSTIEAPSPSLLITPSPQPLVENEPIEVSFTTVESETNMAKETSSNGQESLEKRGSASADHDMSVAESSTAAYLPLTEKCHHYTRRSDVDWDIQK
jgi:hypothetical protein